MNPPVPFEMLSGVGILPLNGPERHTAINDETGALHSELLNAALRSSEVGAILLQGAGKSFRYGRDTSVLGHRVDNERDYCFSKRHQQTRTAILDSNKPVVAAFRRAANGGGCEKALVAGIRVAANSLKMGVPKINYGLLPNTGGIQHLSNFTGPSRTRFRVMISQSINTKTDLEWGAIDFLVEPPDVDKNGVANCYNIGRETTDRSRDDKIDDGPSQCRCSPGRFNTRIAGANGTIQDRRYAEARAVLREGQKPVYTGR